MTLQYINKKIKSFFDDKLIFSFFTFFILTLIVHGFMFGNKITNHDDIHQLYNIMDLRISGRWFLQYATGISSPLSMPWMNGLLITLYGSISFGLIVKLLNFKNKFVIFLMAFLITSFPSDVAGYLYMNSADGYVFALMMSTIASFVYIKCGNIGKFLFIILTVLSLATYQIYLGYSVSLVVIHFAIKAIYENESFKNFFKQVFILGIISILALILYIITVRYIFVVELTSYQGLNSIGTFDIHKFVWGVIRAYTDPFRFFIIDNFRILKALKFSNIVLFATTIYILFDNIKEAGGLNKDKILSLFLSLIVLPLTINLVYVLINGGYAGLRMLYSYIIYYVIVFLILDRYIRFNYQKNIKLNKVKLVSLGLTFVILFANIFNFTLYTNKVYFSLYLDNKHLETFTNRLITKIEEKDFYSEDKTINFVGYPDIDNEFSKQYSTDDILASTLLEHKIPGHIHYKLYPSRYLAFNNKINMIFDEEYDKIKDENLIKEIKKRKVYPSKYSIFQYNNEIYVKFKDYSND